MKGRTLHVRSGGETGVDRAALDAAIASGIPYAGWCPRGGWAEDHPSPPGVVDRYPSLIETPSDDPRQRTAWNVRDSDATLLIAQGAGADSAGTELARICGELIFLRPTRRCDLDSRVALEDSRGWLRSVGAGERGTLILNVAGPRESEAPGIYPAAFAFLSRLFEELAR